MRSPPAWLSTLPRQDPRVDWEVSAAAAFASFLTVAAVCTSFDQRGFPATGAMLVVLVALCWWSTVRGGLASAGLGAMFYLGFVANLHGRLALPDSGEALILAAMVVLALITTGWRSLHIRVHRLPSTPPLDRPRPEASGRVPSTSGRPLSQLSYR